MLWDKSELAGLLVRLLALHAATRAWEASARDQGRSGEASARECGEARVAVASSRARTAASWKLRKGDDDDEEEEEEEAEEAEIETGEAPSQAAGGAAAAEIATSLAMHDASRWAVADQQECAALVRTACLHLVRRLINALVPSPLFAFRHVSSPRELGIRLPQTLVGVAKSAGLGVVLSAAGSLRLPAMFELLRRSFQSDLEIGVPVPLLQVR